MLFLFKHLILNYEFHNIQNNNNKDLRLLENDFLSTNNINHEFDLR